jgi:hypothetical protein
MKGNVCSVLGVLTMAMVLEGPGLQAQSRLVVNVPFDFSLGQNEMAAGKYEVESISDQLAAIRNLDTGVAQVFIKSVHMRAGRPGSPRLVFDKYGEQYFLREVWDGNTGIQLQPSRRERELLVANSWFSSPENVTVAMN